MIDTTDHTYLQETLGDQFDDLFHDLDGEWSIEHDDLNGLSYDLDIPNKKIIFHNYGLRHNQLMASSYFAPQYLLSVAEALRMVRHVEWLDGCISRYHPEAIIQIGRICVADAHIHKIITAWNFKLDDNESLWKHLLCSDLSDMALAFEQSFEHLLSSGMDDDMAMKKSMAIAFNRWFADENRTRDCDHDTLNLIDQMIDECTIFGGRKLEGHAIPCLTLMAGTDTSYIDQILCNDVLRNPYYRTVNDPINEAYLMQIINDMNKINVAGITFSDPDLAARFAICD